LTPGYYDTNAELDQTEIIGEENNIDTDAQTETSEIITTTVTTTVTTITDYAPENTTALTTENNKPSNKTKSSNGIFKDFANLCIDSSSS